LFLPALALEGSVKLDVRELLRNSVPLLLLANAGVLLATLWLDTPCAFPSVAVNRRVGGVAASQIADLVVRNAFFTGYGDDASYATGLAVDVACKSIIRSFTSKPPVEFL
jgi:hypothetical protein